MIDGISAGKINSGKLGISRIAKVTETIVPIMACFYIIGSLIVIFANYKEIPYAFYSIVVGAFKPSAISGGAGKK